MKTQAAAKAAGQRESRDGASRKRLQDWIEPTRDWGRCHTKEIQWHKEQRHPRLNHVHHRLKESTYNSIHVPLLLFRFGFVASLVFSHFFVPIRHDRAIIAQLYISAKHFAENEPSASNPKIEARACPPQEKGDLASERSWPGPHTHLARNIMYHKELCGCPHLLDQAHAFRVDCPGNLRDAKASKPSRPRGENTPPCKSANTEP